MKIDFNEIAKMMYTTEIRVSANNDNMSYVDTDTSFYQFYISGGIQNVLYTYFKEKIWEDRALHIKKFNMVVLNDVAVIDGEQAYLKLGEIVFLVTKITKDSIHLYPIQMKLFGRETKEYNFSDSNIVARHRFDCTRDEYGDIHWYMSELEFNYALNMATERL